VTKKTVDPVKEFNFGRVESLNISADDNGPYLTVKMSLPVPGFDARAEIEETFYINRKRHKRLRDIVNGLYEEIEDTIKEGRNVEGMPCASCISICCSEFADSIYVTHEDVERIMEHVAQDFAGEPMTWVDDYFWCFADGRDYAIYGRAKTKMWRDAEYCVFFDTEERKCGIHKVKPQVCQDYSPHNCMLWEKDYVKLMKAEQLTRKRKK
jgi:Fe-S-cluster containining protein